MGSADPFCRAAHKALFDYVRSIEVEAILSHAWPALNAQRHKDQHCAWWHAGTVMVDGFTPETRAMIQQGRWWGGTR
jgi:hypothetical protein